MASLGDTQLFYIVRERKQTGGVSEGPVLEGDGDLALAGPSLACGRAQYWRCLSVTWAACAHCCGPC